MKKLAISAFVACALSLAMAQSQQSGSQSSQQPNQGTNQSMSASQNGSQNMSGKVSNSGKTFTSDAGQKYKVDNPSSLKNYNDQEVAVVVFLNPDTGDLHIIQVQSPQ